MGFFSENINFTIKMGKVALKSITLFFFWVFKSGINVEYFSAKIKFKNKEKNLHFIVSGYLRHEYYLWGFTKNLELYCKFIKGYTSLNMIFDNIRCKNAFELMNLPKFRINFLRIEGSLQIKNNLIITRIKKASKKALS